MLISTLAILYITLICWTAGDFLIRIISISQKQAYRYSPGFAITCLAGLMAITPFAGLASLFIPLGGATIQLLLFTGSLLLLLNKSTRNNLRAYWHQLLTTRPAILIFFSTAILLLLLLHAAPIIHPDTLEYHSQLITWVEEYPVIPGLANLHNRFGLQSAWFVDFALFGFSFTGTPALGFLNAAVLCWFLLFLSARIQHCFFREQQIVQGLCWLLFLGISLISYTQFRLTAVSASPDYMVALVILTVVYLLTVEARPFLLLVLLFIAFAVSLKLSALPLIVPAGYLLIQFLRKKEWLRFASGIFFPVVFLVPFAIRNVISSGYLFFPYQWFNWFKPDWQYNEALLPPLRDYVTAFARNNVVATAADSKRIAAQPVAEWIIPWWQALELTDKLLLVINLVSLLVFFFSIKRWGKLPIQGRMLILTLLAALLAWFIASPGLRFASGYLMAFPALIYVFFFGRKKLVLPIAPQWVLLSVSLIFAGFISFRLFKYPDTVRLLQPAGITSPLLSPDCKTTVEHQLIIAEMRAKNSRLCKFDTCGNWKPRGKTVAAGFAPVKK